MIRILLALLALAVLALGYSLWLAERADSRADKAEAAAGQAIAALSRANDIIQIERGLAEHLAGIAAAYEQEKKDALDREAGLRADLAAGTVKLRREWQGCETAKLSAASAATRELDGAAEVRERLAAEIVRLGAEADAQVRGLQAIVTADRSTP